MALLTDSAWTYAVVRQFPAALKLYDRALDITPNDPDVMASKASIYQAQGNLQEAARLLSETNGQKPFGHIFATKITQLRLERESTVRQFDCCKPDWLNSLSLLRSKRPLIR